MTKVGKFVDFFVDVTKQGTKIPQECYLKSGKYPIVDQGREKISGRWDSDEGLFKDVPVIIFGDHTRAIKYITEPFFLGADGVKILRPANKEDNPKYLYYALQAAKIPNLGYSRHFKIVKELNIRIYPRSIQDEIVKIFENIDLLMEEQQYELSLLDQLVKSRFIEMFGDPDTNPYGFESATIGDICSSIVRGPFGSALKKEFFVPPSNSTYKVYEQKHAIQKSATIGTYYISAQKFDELHRFECMPGDILMSCSGTMGELYQLPDGCERGIINQALCKFTLGDKILPIVFLTYMKQTIGRLETKGSGIQNIAAVSYVKAMPIILPPMELQNQFAEFVAVTDKSKYYNFSSIKSCLLAADKYRQEWMMCQTLNF